MFKHYPVPSCKFLYCFYSLSQAGESQTESEILFSLYDSLVEHRNNNANIHLKRSHGTVQIHKLSYFLNSRMGISPAHLSATTLILSDYGNKQIFASQETQCYSNPNTNTNTISDRTDSDAVSETSYLAGSPTHRQGESLRASQEQQQVMNKLLPALSRELETRAASPSPPPAVFALPWIHRSCPGPQFFLRFKETQTLQNNNKHHKAWWYGNRKLREESSAIHSEQALSLPQKVSQKPHS